MTITTGGPPGTGFNGVGLIFTQFGVELEPTVVMRQVPDASLNLKVEPSISMMPPQNVTVRVAPTISMAAGARQPAAFSVGVSPRIGMSNFETPDTAFVLNAVNPSMSMQGGSKEPAAFALHPTVSLGMSGTRSVTFDAAGVGDSGVKSSYSWSQTITGNSVLVVVNVNAALTATAKVGSTAMTQLYALNSYTGSRGIIVFGLLTPPTGSQNISVSLSGSDAGGASSASYFNVSSFGTPLTATGTGATASHTVSGSPGTRLFQVFSGDTHTFSSYSQSQRYNQTYISGQHIPMVFGDAPGGSVTFYATTTASDNWGSIVVPLIP
ncbi:hypothetical protein [Mycobacterium arosiense]|uniref:hypothetical protein n=1 Tax=Mycobacterium arosiense TaxID=425468 RepID=UPI0009F2DA34|nr:hypothetical protein [Mycobacterium arosiense]